MRDLKFKIVYQHEGTGEITEWTVELGEEIPEKPGWNVVAKQQFVGKKDAIEKELIEGDICRQSWSEKVWEVVYSEACFYFMCDTRMIPVYEVAQHEITIIGDKYNNPEMLEV